MTGLSLSLLAHGATPTNVTNEIDADKQARLKAFADSVIVQYTKKQDSKFLFAEKPKVNFEVLYFYSNSCPHCYEFDPYVQNWKKQMRDDVSFHYIPVTFQNNWEVTAKGSLIAKDLKLNNFNNNIYEYIHKKGYRINKMEDLRDFFSDEYSIDTSVFNSLYNSVDINMRIEKYNKITDDFEVDGTPSLVLITKNKKTYITSPSSAQGPINAIFSLEYLMSNERKEYDKQKEQKN